MEHHHRCSFDDDDGGGGRWREGPRCRLVLASRRIRRRSTGGTSPSTVTDCTLSDGRSRGPRPRVTPPNARRRRRDVGPGRSQSVPQRSPHCRHWRGHQAAARPDEQRTVRSRRGRRRCGSSSTRMATIRRAAAAAIASCASAWCDARGSTIRRRPLAVDLAARSLLTLPFRI